MDDEQERLMEIFNEARAKASAEERDAYLKIACGGDAERRRQVEALLQAHTRMGDFLKPPADDPPVQEGPGSVIGHYKLLEQIGEGGFGVVFMAEQKEPIRRRVALKIIKAGMDTKEVVARFEAERQALALMDHPNIARVLDAGTTESGRPYFVMELVNGIPITDYCDRHNLPMPERLELFIQVCHAVLHAHQKGIIHRDLKPTNILITVIDGNPVPKIIDFGVAKALGQRLTEKTLFTSFQTMIGTPTYMSPEQAELSGVDVDTRSDIYSLGVLLYELLTGVTPFDAETLHQAALDEVRRIIREVDPPKPSTRLRTLGDRLTEVAQHRHVEPSALSRHVHGDLDWIVMKALEKDRARRYETAGDLVEDIQRHLEHQPVLASPPGTLYRANKFIRRHRMGVAMAASIATILLAGLIVSLVAFTNAARERDHAITAEQQTERERNHAELLAAEAALEKGQAKLEAGDSWGLQDFVEAYKLAEHHPAFQEKVGRRWSTWHAFWDRQTLAMWPMYGTPSPDHLHFASVLDWPSANTSREVRLYDSLTGAMVAGPMMHESVAVDCAFSPDRQVLATLTDSGVIHFWDCRTGRPIRPPCETGVRGLNQVSFSADGRYMVAFTLVNSGQHSTTVVVLHLSDPQEPVHLLAHRYPVCDARFTPDGKLLAVMCRPDLQVWRTSDFMPAGPPLKVMSLSEFVEFSADGMRMAFCPQGSTGIGLLDTRTMQVVRVLPEKATMAKRVGFSHDGRLLASFAWNHNFELWRMESGDGPYATRRTDVDMYGRFAFNRDDSLLAFGENIGTVRVLRTSDGQIVQTLHAPKFPKPVFLTNGILAIAGAGPVLFWDPMASPLPGNPLNDDALAYALAFDRSGEFLAVGSEGELRLWKMQPSPRLERIITMPGNVVALTFSDADGEFVAFGDDDSLTRVEPHTGRTTTAGNFGLGAGLSALFSPDGSKLVLFDDSETVVINTRTGAFQWLEPPKGANAGAHSAAFRPDSKRLALGMGGWFVRLYDTSVETNALLGMLERCHSSVEGLAYYPDGNLLAVCLKGNTLHLYDSEKDRNIGSVIRTSVNANLARFSADGLLLAVAGPLRDGGYAVELWHVDPQRGLFASGVCLRQDQPVWSMAFSPDNRTLIVGGVGSTRLWHLPVVPKSLEEVQSQTWRTLGFRKDEQGNQVYLNPPTNGIEEIRARLTQELLSPDTPLDAARKLPPAKALSALQQLADQHPGTRVYQRILGRLHADLVSPAAKQSSWSKAMAHADEAIRLGNDYPYIHYQRALLCLGADDVEGYRTTCRAMAERFKSSADPAVIKWVGWSAALAPGALDDYSGLIERLQRAVPRVRGRYGPAYRLYLGAALARAGQYAEAVAELEQVDRHLKTAGANVEFSPIYYRFLLAICHAHLGHEAEARRYFDAASTDTQNLLHSRPGDSSTTSTISWNRKLTLQRFQEEARSLLNPAPLTASSR